MNKVPTTQDNPQGEKAPPGAQKICITIQIVTIYLVDTCQIFTIQI